MRRLLLTVGRTRETLRHAAARQPVQSFGGVNASRHQGDSQASHRRGTGVFRAQPACECRHGQGRTLTGANARLASTDSQPTSQAAGSSDGARTGSAHPTDEREPASRLLEHSLPYVKSLVRRLAACSTTTRAHCICRRGGRTTPYAQERLRLVYLPRPLVRRAWQHSASRR